MKIQNLNKYFEKTPESQQALVDLLGEAGVQLEKAGKRLGDIRPNDHLEVLNYGMMVGMFSALAEFGLGVDVDGDPKDEEKQSFSVPEEIVEAKKEADQVAAVCPDVLKK